MVKVYFESHGHAELVAIFERDELYNACLPTLEQIAGEANMTVTESVEDSSLRDLE